jgi:rod shape-determining protein MreC
LIGILSRPFKTTPLISADLALNLRLLGFALLAVGAMLLDHRGSYLEPLRGALATVVYPLQYVIQLPVDLGATLQRRLAEQETLLAENRRLRQQQLFQSAQLQKLTALEAENRRLRALLESSTQLRERVLIAELMTIDFDPYRHRILLNKGSLHGVHIGQPLLDQRGVVGQIVHANPLTASAILITDPNHALPVQINRNGMRTLALGSGDFQQLRLPFVPNNHDIRLGDLLITSGLGGRFPRGYPVAEVTEVAFDPGSPFARISARPTAQLDRIREVLLVIGEPRPQADSQLVGPLKQP